jgi:hypothetical protein
MTDHANRLWELLGELEARPKTLDRMHGNWYCGGFLIPFAAAHMMVADAARRVCDANGIVMECHRLRSEYFPRKYQEYLTPDLVDYESALIAGLEWIIAEKAES